MFHRSSKKGDREEEASRGYLGQFPFLKVRYQFEEISTNTYFFKQTFIKRLLCAGYITRSWRYRIHCSSFLSSGAPKLLFGCPPVVIST